MTVPTEAPISEAARERETFKYDSLEISTAALRDPEGAKPIPSAVLSSTPDPGLTAFAQLGLYRLDGARALVSLFDRKNQHIVAEALRATPLNPGQDELDLLWLCGTAVPRDTSICEHVIAGPAALMTIPGNSSGNSPNDLPVSVVLDLDQDERFCNIKDPHKRFYIGVPIRAPSGINIGVYCIFDDKPRKSVSPVEVQFIRDMSRTIMDYLDAKRSHECYRREERMVRGLGSFVEGKATLSNWSQSSNPSSFQDLPGVQEGSLNKRLRGADRRTSKSSIVGPRPKAPTDLRADSTSAAPANLARDSPNKADSTPSHKPRPLTANSLQEDVGSVISKASNIIRESLEVAGVVYLDASIRTFGGLVGQEMSSPRVLGKPSSDESSSDDIPASHTGDAADSACCRVLGYSTSQTSSVSGDEACSPLTTLPEKSLHYLLQRYPHGKIYNLEPDVVLPSDFQGVDLSLSVRQKRSEATTPKATRGETNGKLQKPKLRQTMRSLLAKMFPGARSVAFVPLWDSQRHRWFAGSFVWTRTPTRIFTPENELSYLKVYGLTIMAEVTRLHIKAADKTKMDVLGSISHELRSPLHGVVGAVELLRQTPLEGSQQKILRTIQISSRTLLDTIDHLLDHGKMNGLIKSSKLERGNSTTRLEIRQDPATTASDASRAPVQLDRLAEEVVESVLAGYGYMHLADTNGRTTSDSKTSKRCSSRHPVQSDGSPTENGPEQQHIAGSKAVQLFLDIAPAESWSFLAHPGAFRRVIMNLFGNSLKFTKAGFIRVHLTQESSGKPGYRTILLTVSDSGKGISEEYLRNQLYTPFAQEDHFAPGTGLGLSLVRQVVMGLGGEIHVSSEVGRGTTVTVSLPLPVSEEMWTDEEEEMFSAAVDELAGLRLLLRGKEADTTAGEGQLGLGSSRQPKSQLKLIESICQEWLKMEVVPEAGPHSSPPDLIISAGGNFPGLDTGDSSSPPACPHILAYRSPDLDSTIANHQRVPALFDIIPQPFGPRKLAKSLYDVRRRWKQAQLRLAEPAKTTSSAAVKPLLTSTPSQAAELTDVLQVAGIIDGSSRLTPSTALSKPQQSTPDGKTEATDNDVLTERVQSFLSGPPPAMTATPAQSRRRVLIVDDNPINRKILAAYMKKIEQPHSMATNGLEALEMYKESPSEYSCILTDISMPVMDGLESSRRAREFERARRLRPCKIIALTGLSGTDVQQDAFASGIDVFLTRPVTLKSVVDTLDALGVRYP